jgi:hypothetical protein
MLLPHGHMLAKAASESRPISLTCAHFRWRVLNNDEQRAEDTHPLLYPLLIKPGSGTATSTSTC